MRSSNVVKPHGKYIRDKIQFIENQIKTFNAGRNNIPIFW